MSADIVPAETTPPPGTVARPTGQAVAGALATVGSGSALAAMSAPWGAVMATGLTTGAFSVLALLAPTWLAQRRAARLDRMADDRLRALIVLKSFGVETSTATLRIYAGRDPFS